MKAAEEAVLYKVYINEILMWWNGNPHVSYKINSTLGKEQPTLKLFSTVGK